MFELLTLRTPFEAASYVEMIDQLRSSEPPRLGGLRRDVPRDLDTVCLKCLEKQSVDRYASAGALAEDLGRVLNEQPIQAKRPGWLELFQRWCFQPQRIRDAALFGTGYNVVLFTWLVLFQISSHSLNLYSAGQEQAVRIDWLMCLVLQAISTLFCFLITRGYLKFLPIMLLISATHLLLAVGNGLGYLSIYQAIYSESPLLRWSVHSLMVVACLLEVALFAIAMCARRRIGR